VVVQLALALRAFLLAMRADFRARLQAPLTYFHRTWAQSTTTLQREYKSEEGAIGTPRVKVERDFIVCHNNPPQI
jgi:hypothetical protein